MNVGRTTYCMDLRYIGLGIYRVGRLAIVRYDKLSQTKRGENLPSSVVQHLAKTNDITYMV